MQQKMWIGYMEWFHQGMFIIWLVVWNMKFIFPFSWECHDPNWLIFFRGVGWNHPPVYNWFYHPRLGDFFHGFIRWIWWIYFSWLQSDPEKIVKTTSLEKDRNWVRVTIPKWPGQKIRLVSWIHIDSEDEFVQFGSSFLLVGYTLVMSK